MSLDHAVVLGGSLAGLLAAAGLSESFDKVTIVERDELEDAPSTRRGVPQGNQAHMLMPLGLDRFNDLVPGFEEYLVDNGCDLYDFTGELPFYTAEGWCLRANAGIRTVGFLRPKMEWLLRRRVLELPNVEIIKGTATALSATSNGGTVNGAHVKGLDGGQLEADLVVDATGRNSKAGAWIEALGYVAPEEVHLRPYMGYVTSVVRFPDGALPEGVRGIGAPTHPGNTRGGSFQPCGDGNHILVAAGMMRDYPEADHEAVLDFLEQGASPLVGRFARKAELVEPPVAYRMVGNQRRLWEKLERRPEGFVVLGDAVTSFNPVYGQGMTMASLGATILRDAVRASTGRIAGLAEKVQRELAPWTDVAFATAASQDAFYEGVEFVNMDQPPQEAKAAGAALAQVATEDMDVMMAMRRAAYYMDMSDLTSDKVQSKIQEWVSTGRKVSDVAADPERIPDAVPYPG
ncbi:NAD(P)/FAD-dependent oxidoreductase [Nocardia sp. NPDC004123]